MFLDSLVIRRGKYVVQILRENNFEQRIEKAKIEDGEKISLEKTTNTVKRAASYLSALQTSDGHWPAHLSGSLFFTPALVSSIYSNKLTYIL